MKKIIPVIFLILTGCAKFTPQYFGISNAEWLKLSPQKQDELQQMFIYQTSSATKAAELSQKKTPSKNSYPIITIRIFGGKTITPPFTEWSAYKPTTFNIAPEACVDSVLISELPIKKNEFAPKQVNLRSCYKNGILFLDPSKYDINKQDGTMRIHYSPLWESGFTYKNINTYGYVRLKNINVFVKIQK